ncbi:MAG: type VI secretion system baseplate subunit TssK [Planctomycetota bacterium]|nr:MAG: type VI secretion system baseplate subunit TssK [Planctomycetota bacterium]
MTVQVHWHEGLFLQPHHLQAMQRQMLHRISTERRLGWAYPHGVIEAKLSTDELENMRLRFDKLHLILPSGLELLIPDNADLPALDIEEVFNASTAPFTVSIGVPLWYAKRANAMDIGSEGDWRVKRLYKIAEVDQADENTGENTQTVLVRRLNARLLLPDDDRSDLETVPLVRIMHAAGEETGVPRLDPTFLPPCMVLSGSPVLREMLRDIANQVEAARKEAAQLLSRGGFNAEAIRGVLVPQMMRLQTLNHYAGRLSPLVQAPSGVSPFDMYLELRGLLGELAALTPDSDPFEAPKYDHENPAVAFLSLCEKIRTLLRGEGPETWIRAVFRMEDGIFITELEPKHVEGPNEYFLGIRTRRDPRELAKLVEDQDEFKLIAKSMARTRVRGVKLQEERHPPMQLPAQVGLHYYRLLRPESQRMWDKICAEKALAVNFKGVESSGFEEVALYMTVPG